MPAVEPAVYRHTDKLWSRTSCGLVLLLAAAAAIAADHPIVLDGHLEEAEWAEAAIVASGPGWSVRRLDGQTGVQLGIKTELPASALLLISDQSGLSVGHIGGALGHSRYRDGRLLMPIRWSLRDPDTRDKFNPSSPYTAEQDAFEADHGWVASTNMMGRPGHLEIRIADVGADWQIVFALVGDDERHLISYPKRTAPLEPRQLQALLRGEPPLTLGTAAVDSE